MKYLSILVLIFILTWSWRLIHFDTVVSDSVQDDLKPQVALEIQKAVQAKQPGAINVFFTEMWGEILNPAEVKFRFAYTYTLKLTDGETTEENIRGTVTLTRIEEATADSPSKWKMHDFSTSNNAITFTDGIVVTPGESQ